MTARWAMPRSLRSPRSVDSGAPQGDPAEHAQADDVHAFDSEWFIGKPDLLVTTDKDFTMYPQGTGLADSISTPKCA